MDEQARATVIRLLREAYRAGGDARLKAIAARDGEFDVLQASELGLGQNAEGQPLLIVRLGELVLPFCLPVESLRLLSTGLRRLADARDPASKPTGRPN